MNSRTTLFIALFLASGAALAQTTTYIDPVRVEAIRVYPDSGSALSFSCDAQYRPKAQDVDSLLQIKDPKQTQPMTLKLMSAVREACAAGVPAIVVTRGKEGLSLTWRPYDEPGTEVTTH